MCSRDDDPTGWGAAADEDISYSRAATRDDWDSQELADALNRLTEERERQRLQERIRLVGWVFAIGFVVLFLIVIKWMQ